jgi:hypothetical protein
MTTETQLRSMTVTQLLAMSFETHESLLDWFAAGDEHRIRSALTHLAAIHGELATACRRLSENGLLTGDGWRALGHELGATPPIKPPTDAEQARAHALHGDD